MLDAQDMEAIIQSIVSLGRYADSRDRKNLKITYKEDNSPVTEIDMYLSNQLTICLKSILPDIDVVSEENIISPKSNTFWLLDPIDGTRDYLKGRDGYTINVGLIIDGKPEFGFMYNPPSDCFCYTDSDQNLQIINGRRRESDDAIIASTGSRGDNKLYSIFCREYRIRNTIRASSAVKLGWLASGAVDVVPAFYQTMEWDIAAGHAILKSAGGNILDLNGYEMNYHKPEWINEGFLAYNKNFANQAH